MRRLPLSLLIIAVAAVDAAASSVRVQEIGLEGYYATEPVPTRAQVVVSNSRSEPQDIELNFWIRDLGLGPNRRENHFRLNVALGPNEQRVLEVPLLIFEAREPVLEVEARDTTGALLARDRRPLERPVEGHLVVILCAQEAACKAAQAGVSFSGTPEEQTTKGKLFKVVAVRQPQAIWWAYAAAQSIVLAMPADRLAREQRSALEEYVRQGGSLCSSKTWSEATHSSRHTARAHRAQSHSLLGGESCIACPTRVRQNSASFSPAASCVARRRFLR
jgi:hypothetical protein